MAGGVQADTAITLQRMSSELILRIMISWHLSVIVIVSLGVWKYYATHIQSHKYFAQKGSSTEKI